MVRGLTASASAISLFDIPCWSQDRTSLSLFERPSRIFSVSDTPILFQWRQMASPKCKIQTNAADRIIGRVCYQMLSFVRKLWLCWNDGRRRERRRSESCGSIQIHAVWKMILLCWRQRKIQWRNYQFCDVHHGITVAVEPAQKLLEWDADMMSNLLSACLSGAWTSHIACVE